MLTGVSRRPRHRPAQPRHPPPELRPLHDARGSHPPHHRPRRRTLIRSMPRPLAIAMLLTTTMIWGFAFVAQKSAMDTMGPYTFAAARYLLGGLCILPARPRRMDPPQRRRLAADAASMGIDRRHRRRLRHRLAAPAGGAPDDHRDERRLPHRPLRLLHAAPRLPRLPHGAAPHPLRLRSARHLRPLLSQRRPSRFLLDRRSPDHRLRRRLGPPDPPHRHRLQGDRPADLHFRRLLRRDRPRRPAPRSRPRGPDASPASPPAGSRSPTRASSRPPSPSPSRPSPSSTCRRPMPRSSTRPRPCSRQSAARCSLASG